MDTDTRPAPPASSPGADDPTAEVRSRWLVRLRWGSVAVELLIVIAFWRGAPGGNDIPLLLVLVAAEAATNLALWWWLRRRRVVSAAWSGAILTFDMIQLTALLHFSGGASNPFSVLYLVEITAAAATLGSRWTWFLTALGISGYAALFAMPMEAPPMRGGAGEPSFSRHLEAMWIALSLSAALTAFVVTRITTGLADRDREILAMREKAALRERVSALATLAASAAHELATPLTTVAVAAGELERAVDSLAAGKGGKLREDVSLIRAEVQRCREILDELGQRSGAATGEMPTRFTIDALARELAGRLPRPTSSSVTISTAGSDQELFLPRRVLVRVILSVIQNAIDASSAGRPVKVELRAGDWLEVRVDDRGTGMTPEVLARADEPFFTTKGIGHGLGLGLFVARSLADQLGGQFEISSTHGYGTTVRITLPLSVQVHGTPA